MNIFYFISAIFLVQIVSAQSSQSFQHSKSNLKLEQISYALVDLGFNGRMISLIIESPILDLERKIDNPVKKSTRTLEEILSIHNKESKNQNFKKSFSTYSYHLIAGCFSIIENAQDYVCELNEKGYNSSVVGKTLTGLYMVNFNSYKTRDEAYIEFDKLNNLGFDVWIKKM
tara:strand:+ start:335 stop:850 length:516 start_codon:yes stop_codon:yes gene_type:complete